jgi:hypothetical protein
MSLVIVAGLTGQHEPASGSGDGAHLDAGTDSHRIENPCDDAQNPAGIDGMRLMYWLGAGGSGNEGDRVEGDRPTDPARGRGGRSTHS